MAKPNPVTGDVTEEDKAPPPSSEAATTASATASPGGGGEGGNGIAAFEDDDDGHSDAHDELLTMGFNQDGGCLAVGTGTGFRICNACPYQETFRRVLREGGGGGGGDESGEVGGSSSEIFPEIEGGGGGGGGIGRIEMLYRTNLLALTGGGTSPQYPPNKVLIYDDHLQRTIGELSFRQKVLRTKLRRDRIVVVLRDRVYVYNFSDLGLLDKIHTGENPLGLIGISTDNSGVGGGGGGGEGDGGDGGGASTSLGIDAASGAGGPQQRNGMVLACPGSRRGQVRVELYGLRRTAFVDAHESGLGALALSVDGSLLATASEKGTVIRLFDTRGGSGATLPMSTDRGGGSGKNSSSSASSACLLPLREFRRGVERATISCLTFSLDARWLGCASDHGTVHVFCSGGVVDDNDGGDADEGGSRSKKDRKPKKSWSYPGMAMRMLPRIVSSPKKYFVDGEHSVAQVRGVPRPRACAFVPDRDRTIAVAGLDEHGNGCLLLADFGDGPSGSASGGGKGADREAKRLGYHRFFKKGGASANSSGRSGRRRKSKSKEEQDTPGKAKVAAKDGAYIDDNHVAIIRDGMEDICFGDENEDEFVPIDTERSSKAESGNAKLKKDSEGEAENRKDGEEEKGSDGSESDQEFDDAKAHEAETG